MIKICTVLPFFLVSDKFRCGYTIVTLFLFLTGCVPAIKNEQELHQYLTKEANGFVQSKSVDDLEITVKYLPPEFQTLREIKGIAQSERFASQTDKALEAQTDSILAYYQKQYVFLLTVKPKAAQPTENQENRQTHNPDVMYRDISNYSEFKERVTQVNFHADEYIYLVTSGKRLKPLLHTLENTYSLMPQRTIYLVFADENLHKTSSANKDLSYDDLELVFEDQLFSTGIHHFLFSKKKLAKLSVDESMYKNAVKN
jgi:protein-tyrosine-phosphatase